MSRLARFVRSLKTLLRPETADRELDDEVRFHMERQIDANLAAGMTPEEARYAALRIFGGVDQTKEQCRDARGLAFFDTLCQDLRFAKRLLIKQPGFTTVAVLTLAVGIGANTAIFTLVNAWFLKGLPFPHSDRIAYVATSKRGSAVGGFAGRASYPDFRDWQSQNKAFQDLGALALASVNLSDDGLIPERFNSARITANGFSVLAAKPLLGRDFGANEDQPGAPPVAILSYAVWQNRYGGDQHIIGRTIRINGVLTSVIGVMPKGMEFPYFQRVWVPLIPTEQMEKRDSRSLIVFGRLAEGATLSRAQSDMDLIANRLQAQNPTTNRDFDIRVRPYIDVFTNEQTRMLFVSLLGSASFLLLIACINVANLTLSRSLARRREIAIRAALGASRRRIARQLLMESVLLGGLAGVVGFSLSLIGSRALLAAVPDNFASGWPFWIDKFSIDYRVFLYATMISVAVVVLFGLAPALHVSKVDLMDAMKGGFVGGRGRKSHLLAGSLVVGQFAMALVLLTSAGLIIRTMLNQWNMTADLERESILTMWFNLQEQKYSTAEDRVSFHDRLTPELTNVPGVEAVAFASFPPVDDVNKWPFELEGAPETEAGEEFEASGLFVSPEYFRVLGRSLTSGRAFTDDDGRPGKMVAIVNERFANKYWPGDSALGKRLRLTSGTEQPWLTVIGVAPNIKQTNLDQTEAVPIIYLPYRQQTSRTTVVLLRTTIDPQAPLGAVRRVFQTADSELPLFGVITLADSLALQRFNLFNDLFVIFGIVALVIAGIGVYAVIAYWVSQQTREIGIRIALGEAQSSVIRRVTTRGLRLAAFGLAIGVLSSIAVTRVMTSMLVGVSPTDPATLLAVSGLLTIVATLASYIPARRAAGVDPMIALRSE